MDSAFFDISVVLLVGTAFATLAKLLNQPMIPAYIIAGIILGPAGFAIIQHGDLLNILSTFGIAFLLFLVGIELDLRHFLKAGKIGVFLGFIQMSIAVVCGYVLNVLLGFSMTESVFLAIALGFSSTIVVTKLLAEKKELDTLYGQIIIGVLLTQDAIAVLILIFFNVFTGAGSTSELPAVIGMTLLKGVGLALLAIVSARYILTSVFKYFARSAELLFLGSICWCLVFSLISIKIGFSIEVGALLAGVSLSILPYNIEIGHRISSLRDFFLPIFFAVLGGELIFDHVSTVVAPTIILSLFVLFGSSLVVIAIMIALGYRTRTAFQAGMTLGQVSEFSFIFMHMGYQANLLDQRMVSLVALIGLITMTLSSYCMEYTDQLYAFVRPLLKKFERHTHHVMEDLPGELNQHAVLFGYHTMGFKIHEIFARRNIHCVVVDHNPNTIERLQRKHISHIYGSIGDIEVLEKVKLTEASYIVSTVPSRVGTLALLNYVREHKMNAQVIVLAFQPHDAIEFYDKGASYVLFPTALSADHLEHLIVEDLQHKRDAHLEELRTLHILQLE
ncbi:MAG: cation:proton antiporter [Candidatus Kerfeldbacteria bacterium]|nr:cation:proton antiporter [Candidatus Kerfeldbacteria bacterium]